jgi:hypothetical protein
MKRRIIATASKSVSPSPKEKKPKKNENQKPIVLDDKIRCSWGTSSALYIKYHDEEVNL